MTVLSVRVNSYDPEDSFVVHGIRIWYNKPYPRTKALVSPNQPMRVNGLIRFTCPRRNNINLVRSTRSTDLARLVSKFFEVDTTFELKNLELGLACSHGK
jgi:hypothetical protein